MTRRVFGHTADRVVDIVYATVLSVVYALVLLFLNYTYGVLSLVLGILPGAVGVLTGLFVLGGPLGGLIIRKPGAAVFVSTLGAFIESAFGVQWGWVNLIYGLVQGLAAEAAFLLFSHKVYTPFVAALSGSFAACAGISVEIVHTALFERNSLYIAVYISTSLISAVTAGLFLWVIYLALRRSGVLDPLYDFEK